MFLGIHCDVGFDIGLLWIWLVHDFSLLGTCVACSGELVHDHLHLWLRASVESAVISKQEVLQYSFFDLGQGLKPAQVEHLYICFVLDVDSMIAVPKASVSMEENTMLKRVGVSTQPCLTTFETGKVSEQSPSLNTQAVIPSRNCLTMVMNLSGEPNFAMIFNCPLN